MGYFLKSKYLYILPFLFVSILYICKSYGFAIHDFGNYYFGSYLFTQGNFNEAIYAPCYFTKTINNLGFNFIGTYLPFTPITSLVFIPFTFLSPVVAKITFNCISVLLFTNTLFRSFSCFKIEYKYLLIVPIIFFTPLKNGLLFGQFYFILFVLIMESFILYKKDKKWMSALLLSVAVAIKIFPVILLLYYLFSKDIKQSFRILATGVFLLCISLAINGIDIWMFYIKNIFFTSINGGIRFDFALNSQTLDTFLKFLFVKDNHLNPIPWINNYHVFVYLKIIIKTLIITFGVLVHRYSDNKFLQYSFWLVTAILISPNGNTYALILLIIPFIFFLHQNELKKIVLVAVLIFGICNVPWHLFSASFLVLKFPRLILMFLLFGFMIVLFFKKIKPKVFIVAFLLLMAIQLIRPTKAPQKSETVYGGKSLICDYNFNGKNFVIEEFIRSGKHKKTITIPTSDTTIGEPLALKENQIYYNNIKLTDTDDNKMKPMLIGNKVYYLSDYNQGYRLYNLRSIILNTENHQ